ncbi:zinc ribbon domain-containing protein [Rubinisphaera sp. JC750]|uniref:zinc ribbon domain-containing protein n=1 Tax=Rubinisphaera sp. JC750 TaxID=2898658 RepID=UPI001F1D04F4|nr:hypothetical protein [Rubinisphaera sp. JC750]
MPSVTDSLRSIHTLHTRLEEKREALVKGPRVAQARQRKIEQKEQELHEFEETLKQSKMAAERKSLDLKTLESKLEELKGKLNTASSNKEYDIIRGQIQADEMAKSVLEDEILELFEQVDGESAQIPEKQDELESLRKELEAFQEKFQKDAVQLETQIAETEVKLKEAEKVLPPEAAEKYHRLVASKGSRAMALASNGACNNCFLQLTPQQRILIKSDNFLFCTNCGSLLYLEY